MEHWLTVPDCLQLNTAAGLRFMLIFSEPLQACRLSVKPAVVLCLESAAGLASVFLTSRVSVYRDLARTSAVTQDLHLAQASALRCSISPCDRAGLVIVSYAGREKQSIFHRDTY